MSAPCPTFGFVARFEVGANTDRALLMDRFIREAVEARGLACVDVDAGRAEYVIAGEGVQATDADRDVVVSWLASRKELASFSVGPLTDVGRAP